MAGGMSRVQPAKEYLVMFIAGDQGRAWEYLLAVDLSAAMQGAQARANKRALIIESVAEVQWRRDS